MDTLTVLDGRYELRRLMGRGGMADVWAACDRTTGADVAVKVLRAMGADDDARFAAEVRALGLVDHPNLVRLLDAGEHEGRAYLVMELVEGPTLADAVRDGPLLPERAAEVGAALARALGAIHAEGIVHRDVKPGNVLLDGDGVPRLADFGIARLVDAGRLTTSGATMGTAAYLSPEQVEGRTAGPPADVYALGLVLLEALTGRREFDGAPMEAAIARLSRDPEVPAGLPDPWPDLLAAMTARDPGARPAAPEVAARLGADAAVADDQPTDRLVTATRRLELPPEVMVPEAAPAPAPAPARRGLAVPRRVWAAVAGVAVALLAVLVVLSTREDVSPDPVGDVPPPATAPGTPATGEGPLPAPLDDALDDLEDLARP